MVRPPYPTEILYITFCTIQFRHVQARQTFRHRFFQEAIRSCGLHFGGNILRGNEWSGGAVSRLPDQSVTYAQADHVLRWLRQQPEVVSCQVGVGT
ncbi:MAG: hypothetical protein ACFCD0_15335 [Gemmataceae bacterium]